MSRGRPEAHGARAPYFEPRRSRRAAGRSTSRWRCFARNSFSRLLIKFASLTRSSDRRMSPLITASCVASNESFKAASARSRSGSSGPYSAISPSSTSRQRLPRRLLASRPAGLCRRLFVTFARNLGERPTAAVPSSIENHPETSQTRRGPHAALRAPFRYPGATPQAYARRKLSETCAMRDTSGRPRERDRLMACQRNGFDSPSRRKGNSRRFSFARGTRARITRSTTDHFSIEVSFRGIWLI